MDALAAPFPADQIKWRVGATTKDKTKGIALAYIDARHVFDRLDEVVGNEGWQTRILETPSGRVLCELTICGVTKTDGAGDTGMEAEKGAISDAIKRAAVQWGIGRYLYNLPNVWCQIEPAGKSYRLANTPDLPGWATPDGKVKKGKTATKSRSSKKKTEKKEQPKKDEEENAFGNACVKEVDAMHDVFESIGHTPKESREATQEVVGDVLKGMRAAVGQGYVSYLEIEDREHQAAFYRSLVATRKQMVKDADEGEL
jgi:hypothetical protein